MFPCGTAAAKMALYSFLFLPFPYEIALNGARLAALLMEANVPGSR